VIAAALLGAAPAAQADPIVWTATEAIPDVYAKYGGGHSFWLPGFVAGKAGTSTFVFETVGVYTEAMNLQTSLLTGAIHASGNASFGFDAVVNFDNPTGFAPAPKLELKSTAYSVNGGPIDPSTWNFYKFVTDVALTGTGAFSGLNLVLSHKPASGAMGFQVGEGANGKNINMGASGWFYYTIDASSSDYWRGVWSDTSMQRGDINIDLNPVPEPGSVALMGVVIAGALVWRRKRRRA